MGRFAWVTLATNDSYCLGALVLAYSLRKVGTQHEFAILVAPTVSDSMRERLGQIFNVVQEVNVLDSKDETNLLILKRPELGITFTKLHCWRLTQFEKCVFLDADTLVVKNCDELFEREELSAAPDVGWPDCFNSGVFVYRPSLDTFNSLVQFASEKGSFDGGDQGLLNLYFSGWAHTDISKHLPFIYNMCSTACYSYLPAFKQFGANAKIIHFIGIAKPWLQQFDTESGIVHPSADCAHLQHLLQTWWDLFCSFVHPNLTPNMAGLAGAFAQMTLGAPRSSAQSALEDHFRRQSWEVGNIDYMGRDSFTNIWQKICETLSGPSPAPAPTKAPAQKSRSPARKSASPKASSPPKQTVTAQSEVAKPKSSDDCSSGETKPVDVKQITPIEPEVVKECSKPEEKCPKSKTKSEPKSAPATATVETKKEPKPKEETSVTPKPVEIESKTVPEVPKTVPETKTKSKTKAESKVEATKQAPATKPAPKPEPTVKQAPEPESKPASKPEPATKQAPKQESETKQAPKPEPTPPAAKQAPKLESAPPASKQAPKPEPTPPAAKQTPKAEAEIKPAQQESKKQKPAPKPVETPAPKPVETPAPKPVEQPAEAKVQPEPKSKKSEESVKQAAKGTTETPAAKTTPQVKTTTTTTSKAPESPPPATAGADCPLPPPRKEKKAGGTTTKKTSAKAKK